MVWRPSTSSLLSALLSFLELLRVPQFFVLYFFSSISWGIWSTQIFVLSLFSISWGIWRWVSFVFFCFFILMWFWGWVFSWILIFPPYCSSFGGSCCWFVDDSWECCSDSGAVSRSRCLDCLCSCEVRIALGPPFIFYFLNPNFRISALNWLFKFIKNVLVLKNHSSLHLYLHFQHLCKIYGYVGVIGCRKFANYMILKWYIIYASSFHLMILF